MNDLSIPNFCNELHFRRLKGIATCNKLNSIINSEKNILQNKETIMMQKN